MIMKDLIKKVESMNKKGEKKMKGLNFLKVKDDRNGNKNRVKI